MLLLYIYIHIYRLVFTHKDNNLFLCWVHVSTVRFCQLEETVSDSACVRVCVYDKETNRSVSHYHYSSVWVHVVFK